MKVAHFVQRYPPALGGSEAYFERLSRYLAAAGDAVTVHTTTAVDLEAFWSTRGRRLRSGMRVEGGVTVRRYPLSHIPGQRRILKALSFVPFNPWQGLTLSCNPLAPRMWLDAGRSADGCDLVHASAFPYGWPLLSGLRLARRLGVPYLLTPFLHLGDPESPADRTRRAYTAPCLLALVTAADRVFVQTTVERDGLVRLGIDPARLVLQGMGVDVAECTGGDRARGRSAWGLDVGEVIVGHLANHSVEKGTVDLLRAAQRAWANGCRFRLLLAGPEMPNFRAFWKHYPCKERVVRLGIVDDRQKRDFYAAIDLFALPSRSDSFGLVLLEAWANGVANVAYRAGGVAGVIRHEEDGLLVRCGDLQGLAAALVRLAQGADLRRWLAESGRQRLGVEFRWADKLALVRRTCEEVLDEHRQKESGAAPARPCAAPLLSLAKVTC